MQPKNQMLAEGVGFLPLPDSRFKTDCLTVALFLPLREETAAGYAILSELLARSTASSPSMIALSRRLAALYGATLSSGTMRCGENQVLHFTVSCIKNRYTLQGEDVLSKAVDLLLEMLFDPHLTDGVFDEEDVKQEKRCLLERIAAQVNDKRAFARDGCDRLLANGEPYGISANGTEQTAAMLTPESITAYWEKALKTAYVQWFYLGEDTGETIASRIQSAFANRPRAVDAGETITAYTPVASPRRDTVKMSVNQAKLVMGFRLPAAEPNTEKVMTARMLSALWGGTPHSLLFRNVREKMSLCYYCQAGFDRIKGVLTVDSGVDAANVSLAEQAILDQLETIKKGDFSDEMFDDTRRSLINGYRDSENLQSSMIRWYLGQTLFPPFYSQTDCIRLLEQVTKESVIALAKEVSLCSVFTVLPKEETV